MITVDEQAYPIVVVRSEGDVTLADIRHFTQTLEAILARETPCGVIMLSNEHSVTAPEARSAQARWMKQHKPRIAEICQGFAWVLASPAQLMLYKPILALQGRRMTGCPTAAFGDLDAATAWIQKQLS
jgi:hypothetical protein